MEKKNISKIVLVSFLTTFFINSILWISLAGVFKSNYRKISDSVSGDFANKGETAEVSLKANDIVVEAVKKANPAVVAITVTKNVPIYERYYENVPSPFGDFFGGDFFGFQVPQYRQNGTESRKVGGGSGFLVSEDGYIVTNRHVVEDEEADYTVIMSDGKKYPTKIVARDKVLDLAVLKIEGNDFHYLNFGDSNKIEVGQSVIAIGNALAEFNNTVSLGIVSGLSRSVVAMAGTGRREALDQLIQTDAAINPGNSGGPLIDLHGDVIGVNVAVASGAENIGFALSSNSVKGVVDSVKTQGKIVRPFLGVRYIQIDEELKKKNSLPFDYGVLVQRGEEAGDLAVIPSSPADKVGIIENDVILEADGVKLTPDKNLSAIVRSKKVGDVINLKISSKGKEKTLSVILEEMK